MLNICEIEQPAVNDEQIHSNRLEVNSGARFSADHCTKVKGGEESHRHINDSNYRKNAYFFSPCPLRSGCFDTTLSQHPWADGEHNR